jgi:succinate-semialdehyde dehydrogenase/glutarate-semialdehyde dehydrogenase
METDCYINGIWVPTREHFPVSDPATGKIVGHAADAPPELATAAITSAHDAFQGWAGSTAWDRAEAIRRISRALLEEIDQTADLIVSEQGKPRGQALFEVRYATEWLEWFAEEARRAYGEIIPSHAPNKRLSVHRQPLGVAVAITPWNFPVAMIARKLAPALAAGCTLVVKPAEQTPLSAVALFEAIDRADLPAGVVNLITCAHPESISSALIEDERVRKITFTGSTEVGKKLVRLSATNLARVSLELGGQAPFIVFDDADLESAVSGLLASKFQVNGQSCLCANRVFVQNGVQEDFTELLKGAVKKLRVGPGSDQTTDIGPLIDERGYEKVANHVADALANGAQIECGGKRSTEDGFETGFFFEPTILSHCTDNMLCASEETFGPLIPLLSFGSEDEVVERSNQTPYGLAAYLYTSDLGRATRTAERLEFGIVGVNDAMPASPTAPFGGFKESGLGREGGRDGLSAFMEAKLISVMT